MSKVKQHLLSALAVILQTGAVFVLSTTGARALTEQPVTVLLADISRQCFQVGSYLPGREREEFLQQDGIPATMRPCAYNAAGYTATPSQRFRITPSGSNTFAIVSEYGKCLEVENGSTADGAMIRQSTCNGASHQRWTLEIPYENATWVDFKALHSGKCIAATSTLQQDDLCRSSLKILPIGDNVRIKSDWSQKCLDVHNVGNPYGARIQQWDCLGYHQTNQKWRLEIHDFKEAEYRFLPMHTTGTVLRPDQIGTSDMWNGRPVLQRDYSGVPAEIWELIPQFFYGLRFKIRHVRWVHEYCLDQDNANGFTNGSKVQMWQCHGGTNQKWRFSKLSP